MHSINHPPYTEGLYNPLSSGISSGSGALNFVSSSLYFFLQNVTWFICYKVSFTACIVQQCERILCNLYAVNFPGFQPASFSMQFLRKSLSLDNSDSSFRNFLRQTLNHTLVRLFQSLTNCGNALGLSVKLSLGKSECPFGWIPSEQSEYP